MDNGVGVAIVVIIIGLLIWMFTRLMIKKG